MPRGRVEEAVGRLLDLFPAGLQEVHRPNGVDLAVFTDEAGLERLRRAFPDAVATPLPNGWEDEWKRFHVPMVVGRLWIGPPWLTPRDDLERVVIEPGRAFGTGAHPTTRLCLGLLLGVERGSILDAGCGSGVLAIAAAKLGFRPVLASDVEEGAVETTARNARVNGVRVRVVRADVLTGPLPRVDAVVANITLDVLNALGPRLDCRVAVTSGYLRGQRPGLPGFRHVTSRQAQGWAADRFERE